MSKNAEVLTLQTLLGDYPNTMALKKGEVPSPNIVFDFADVRVPNTAFKDVVRQLKYDVAELAIVTFLQAKTHGKPLVLLPAVIVGTLPHPFLVYNGERGSLTPAELTGRRVGIRAYSVTTATWIRGILQNDFNVDLESIHWVTFEDAHVAEYRDPSVVERAPGGKQLVKMLLDGELDAALVGGPDLKDPRLKPVIPNPTEAAKSWCQRHAAMPINHMVVVKESLARSNPSAVREIYSLLYKSRQATKPAGESLDALQFGVAAIRKSLELIISYSVQQGLIPRRFEIDELFDEATRAFSS